MTEREAKEFVLSEIAAMQAIIENLLNNYVQVDSKLCGELQYAGQRLGMLSTSVDLPDALRVPRKARR